MRCSVVFRLCFGRERLSARPGFVGVRVADRPTLLNDFPASLFGRRNPRASAARAGGGAIISLPNLMRDNLECHSVPTLRHGRGHVKLFLPYKGPGFTYKRVRMGHKTD